MPVNDNIIVNCKLKDCYWNLGKYNNNCACIQIILEDKQCHSYITKQEAERRLMIHLGE